MPGDSSAPGRSSRAKTGKRRRAAQHQARHRQALLFQARAQASTGSSKDSHRRLAFGQASPDGCGRRRRGNPRAANRAACANCFVQRRCLRSRRDAGAMLADVEVDQHIDLSALLAVTARESACAADRDGRPARRSGNRDTPGAASPCGHSLVRPADTPAGCRARRSRPTISASAMRGTFVLGDTGFQFHADDLARFVRLDVRPQPVGTAGNLDASWRCCGGSGPCRRPAPGL